MRPSAAWARGNGAVPSDLQSGVVRERCTPRPFVLVPDVLPDVLHVSPGGRRGSTGEEPEHQPASRGGILLFFFPPRKQPSLTARCCARARARLATALWSQRVWEHSSSVCLCVGVCFRRSRPCTGTCTSLCLLCICPFSIIRAAAGVHTLVW